MQRTREEISRDANLIAWDKTPIEHSVPLILEALLDIRDLLANKT